MPRSIHPPTIRGAAAFEDAISRLMCGNVQTDVAPRSRIILDGSGCCAARMRPSLHAGGVLQGRGIGAMTTPWVFSSTFLPYNGEPIDFLLEDREEPIHGTFEGSVFPSRWADYGAARVRSWRQAMVDPAHEVIKQPCVAIHSSIFGALERFARRLAGKGHRARPAATARSPSRGIRRTA